MVEEITIDTDYVEPRAVRFRSTVRVDPTVEDGVSVDVPPALKGRDSSAHPALDPERNRMSYGFSTGRLRPAPSRMTLAAFLSRSATAPQPLQTNTLSDSSRRDLALAPQPLHVIVV